MAVELLKLACPECSADLMGPEQGPIFGCPRCRRSFDLSRKPPKMVETKFLRPQHRPPTKLVYIPFWRLKIEPKFIVKNPAKKGRLKERVPPLEHVFVWGWHIASAIYLGDPLIEFNQAGADFEIDPEPKGFLAGASVTPEEVMGLARFLYLKFADKHEDVSDVDVNLDPRELILIGAPFYLNEKKLTSALSGKSYRREIIGSYPLIQKT